MNLIDSFRPITRRAIRFIYESPGICQPAGSSDSGSGNTSDLDFLETVKAAGPSLVALTAGGNLVRLVWSSVPEAFFYQIYRSLSPTGPFLVLHYPAGGNEYIDAPPDSQVYYYRVTAIEPNAGVTEFSNVASATLPPVPGYTAWFAPESAAFSDMAGTVPTATGGEVQFWQDLSGNANDAVFSATSGTAGPLKGSVNFNGKPTLSFRKNKNALLTPSMTIGTEMTVFAVVQLQPEGIPLPSSVGAPVSYNSAEFRFRTAFSARTFEVQRGGPLVTDPVVVGDLNPQAYASRVSTTALTLFRAGAAVGSTAVAGLVTPTAKFGIGAREGAVGISQGHFFGELAELIIYPSALSDGQIESVSNYLVSKYDL